MAYGDYGAFVYLNGVRNEGFEDCVSNGRLVHGMMQDGDVKVECYKQGLPRIFKNGELIEYYNDDEIDFFDFNPFHFEIDGYRFYFCNEGKPYVCEMTTPTGDIWRCEYDYMYGVRF